MDLRGYGLPIHSGYAAHPEVQPSPRDQYSCERVYSLCDLSLSDGEDPRDMPPWTSSAKKGRRPETKLHDLKKPSQTLSRNQNPGIDIALRNLNHEVGASLKTFRAFVQCFEAEIEPLRGWAEAYTLDTVWRNKVKDKCRRHKRDKERFEDVTGRIGDCRVALKGAVKNAKILKELWDDKYKIEDQIRAAKKALLYADSIIDLAERASSERVACKQLVFELEEARCLLDGEKHPWIHGDDVSERQPSDVE
ncbi:hypothetical protein N658DRAFT_131085 [Parathielavia hyrcaniae]|uniref:Uncharacterized protein n=1 Tax=Parathielavia hyrcaniae TaxID=113614 RepID=A0AAN6T6G5_9PEZI|nr:hypothetical protein N658DRAFT_131085 [Parathielavia hyrcaniae]